VGVSGTFSEGFRGYGKRIHPQRHRGRKIERRNARAHPQRLSDGPRVDATRNVVQRIAHHQAGLPATDLNHLNAAPHFHARIIQRLAVLLRQ